MSKSDVGFSTGSLRGGVQKDLSRLGQLSPAQDSPTPKFTQTSPNLTSGVPVQVCDGVDLSRSQSPFQAPGRVGELCDAVWSPTWAQGPVVSQTQGIDQYDGSGSESRAYSSGGDMANRYSQQTDSSRFLPCFDLGLPVGSDSIDSTDSIRATAYCDKGAEPSSGPVTENLHPMGDKKRCRVVMLEDPEVCVQEQLGKEDPERVSILFLLLHCESSLTMEASNMAKESTGRGCSWMERAPPPVVHPQKPSTSPHLETIVEDDAEEFDNDSSRILVYISQFLAISKHLRNVPLSFVRAMMVPSC
ncbi:hypothetical protein V6N12_048955 [Hibiscus sabdariffa]|uniref:Uncharacterized protein n=1 Tax=Hibiscus sabdariffa TaxID=183260 RepID=A0ABR2EIS8_9ROSI